MKRVIASLALVLMSALALPVCAQGRAGEQAPDFPPGLFNDGQRYSLKDLQDQGKAVVLFFYEQDCPSCRGLIPQRNQVVAQFKDKPVKFLAVAAGDPMPDARSYLSSTRLNMPVFADAFSLMEKRYGFNISLQNIYQFRVIDPEGKIVGYRMEPGDIERAVAKAKWKFKDGGYHKMLENAVDRFEWGQYADGMRLLRPHLKNSKAEVKDSATKLYETVKAEVQQWFDKAEQSAEQNPVEAHDLYTKVAAAFTGEDLGKKANDGLKKLGANQTVKDELAARKMFDRLCDGLANGNPNAGRQKAKEFAESITKKYPQTPTGKRAGEIAQEL
jgi:peroxiredoxin